MVLVAHKLSMKWISILTWANVYPNAFQSSHWDPELCVIVYLVWCPCLVYKIHFNLLIRRWTDKTMDSILHHIPRLTTPNILSIIFPLYIPSPKEVVPVSFCEASASISRLDSEWWKAMLYIVPEQMFSSTGQFAGSKLSINRDPWAISGDDRDKGRVLAHNQRINERLKADTRRLKGGEQQ